MRIFIFSLFFITIGVSFKNSFSQGSTKIISIVTPNPAQLIKDYQIPVNYYKGVPEINIPLHSLKNIGLEIPVELSYDASGVSIDQSPTWVGLGWSLTCGGVIVRLVNGNCDETIYNGYMNAQRSELIKYKFNENGLDNLSSTLNYNDSASNVLLALFLGSDPSPDKFVFAFNGVRGEFYLDRNGNVITNSKFTINYSIETVNSKRRFKQFTITTDNGTKYIFGKNEGQSAAYYSVNNGYIPPAESSHEVSWFLEKIESPDGTSKINIEYDESFINFSSGTIDKKSSEKYSVTNTYNGYGTRKWDESFVGEVRQGMLFVSKISNDVEEVVFELTPNPHSLSIRRRLNKVKIRNKLTGTEWEYQFTYKDYGPQPHPQRFQLESIKRASNDLEETLYHFYYNSDPIGYINKNITENSSVGIDHWGYNNGPIVYKTRIPLDGPLHRAGFELIPIDRSPNPTYTKGGSLEKIVIPTKGIIEFEFENNDYNYVGQTELPVIKLAGGLRLRKMTYKDGVNSTNDIVKQYSYRSFYNSNRSTGVVPFEPVYKGTYSEPRFTANFWINSPILPIDVGYHEVTEINSDGGKTLYQFNSAREYPPIQDIDEVRAIVYTEGQGWQFKKYVANDIPYLLSDEVNTHLRGTLKTKIILNMNNSKLVETNYTYKSWNLGRLFNIELPYFQIDLNENDFGDPGTIPNAIEFLKKNYIYVNRYDIESEVAVSYSYKPNDISFSTETTVYQYNNFFFPKEIQKTRSDGKIIKTIFTYPTDYNDFAMGEHIGNLLDLKAKGKVIETLKIIDNKIIEGTINEYDNFARVTKKLQMETETDIDFSAYVLNPNNHISFVGNYKEKIAYKYYQGRLVEASENGTTSSWLWGYLNSRVISKVENSKFENIFYTSFEDSGQDDGSPKSGKKVAIGSYVFLPPTWYTPIANSKLSYWYYDADKWNYLEQLYSGGTVVISNGIKIDEVRIHPPSSVMTTYTHDILNGLSAEIDPNYILKRYEYDPFGRLKVIRDTDFNILKVLSYHITD